MSEPEDVILEGAHHAATVATDLWRRRRSGKPRVELDEVRRRLDLLLGAVFGDVLPLVVAEPAAPITLLGRWARRIPRHLLDARVFASTDGIHIRLPRSLDSGADRDVAVGAYRLLAIQQAARATRGTPRLLPVDASLDVQDLYWLSEGAAVDRWLASTLPGMVVALFAARRHARAERPALSLLTARERVVERLLCGVLESAPDARSGTTASDAESVPYANTPSESLAWALYRATCLSSSPGRYRGLPPVWLWGRAESHPSDAPPLRRSSDHRDSDPPAPSARVRTLVRRPRVRPSPDDEDDGQMGMWMIQLDDPQEHVEDPMGLQRPADLDPDKNADDLADSLSELPEARLVIAPGTPSEVLSSEDPLPRRALLTEPAQTRAGIAYPEWDFRIAAYHPARAVVRERPLAPGNAQWAQTVLRRNVREVEEVRRRFERLRPRRIRLTRQLDGADVDISAYAIAYADARAGRGGQDRLYEIVRPVRRDLAISLLVDISGSTDSWLSEQSRIIDVEKEAVLLACEALDALGDRYNVTAFSGEGPEAVNLYPIKRFNERYGDGVRQKIAGLEHDRYTRMGAALRHATAQLGRESAHHRLLLLLTDGKPNDVDVYEGRYGIEDTRQAVAEARLQGIQPFCLTVDREAPSYMPRIFTSGGYAVLRRTHTLPRALVEVVRRLVLA